MMITLDATQKQIWDDWVITCYPEEAVALVIGGVVTPVPNTAEDKLNSFSVEPTVFWEYKENIEAVLHSHCYKITDQYIVDKRIPGEADMRAQTNMNVWWGISATEGESVTDILWFGKDREEPYEGREFIFNVNDCLELVRDYYRRELNYIIRPQPRRWDWFTDQNLFEEAIDREGFEIISIDDIQKDDVVLFNIMMENTNHIGVYLGDDKVLHHLSHRLSGIETLSKWYRQIKYIVRRKETPDGTA